MSTGVSNELALSVSVIMFTSRAALVRCLDALQNQVAAPDFEILVPHDDGLEDVGALRGQFPHVSFLALSGTRTPAELRTHAVSRSSGRIVALLEDHCMPEPDWCARIVAAHEANHAAIGGAVDKGFAPGTSKDAILNWAVYLTDYSRYMPPMAEGEAAGLTDCNVSYKRASLEPLRTSWSPEFHENVVNDLLRQRGETLWFDPHIVVREYRPLTVAKVLRDRYSFGRLFASTRVVGAPMLKRMVWAAASVLMPPVLATRAARNLLTRRRHQGQIVRCMPGLMFVASVWMFGEMVGYLTASPGKLRARSATGGSAALAGSASPK
jgi:hypothetical protein